MKRQRRLISMVVAVAMLFSGLIAAFPMVSAQAAVAGTLPIARYVKTSGTVACATDPQSATYNGTVNINVPLSTAMADVEGSMSWGAMLGAYPHGLEGKNKIAYISYDVTFPADVTVGQITTSNTSSIIDSNKIVHEVKGQTVSFKMYLIDVNWKEIYDAYRRDKQDPASHTVNLTIPYTLKATTKQEAQQFEAATVTGKGKFSTYLRGSQAEAGDEKIANTYVSDNASQPLATGMSACFPDPIKQESKLPADLRGAQTGKQLDTENKQVYVADSKKSTLDVAGVLHVRDAVKNQMKQIEENFNKFERDWAKIALSDVEFGFDASITLPEGMEFSDTDVNNLKLAGTNDFEIVPAQTSFDGRVLKVRFALKDPSKITNYKELHEVVDAIKDDLMIAVSGVKFSDSSKPDTNYTISGTASGTFTAKATWNSRTIPFAFQWNGAQQADEADIAAPEGINFTVKYKADPTPEPKPEDPKVPTKPTKPTAQKPSTKLASTGAAIVGMVVVAGFAIAAGVSLVAMRRMRK